MLEVELVGFTMDSVEKLSAPVPLDPDHVLLSLCEQFGEEVSVASSVALVSERNSNQTAGSPQLQPSVSGDQDPAAALWGRRRGHAQARRSL